MNKFSRNATHILLHLFGSWKKCRKTNVNKSYFQSTRQSPLSTLNLVQFSQTLT